MKIFHDISEFKSLNEPIGIALGTFDGVHTGHQAVIKTLVETCKAENCKSVVMTFKNHPRDLTATSSQVLKLVPIEEKEHQIKALGVDYLILLEFNDEIMSMSPETFVKEVLIDSLAVRYVAVGFDYRFGKGAEGDTNLLRKLAPDYGYELIEVEAVKLGGRKVSSTEIRELIKKGYVSDVIHLLGRAFAVKGEVIHGKQMGRKLGYPTANLKLNTQMTMIKPGVYVSQTYYDQKVYRSLTSVGFNPTFNQQELNIETYLFDFDGDLYGQILTVEFLDHIRAEEKFDSLEDLIHRIDQDVVYAMEFFKD